MVVFNYFRNLEFFLEYRLLLFLGRFIFMEVEDDDFFLFGFCFFWVD